MSKQLLGTVVEREANFMKKAMVTLLAIFSINALAGGGSSIGPGAPQIQFGCTDLEGVSKYVQIYRSPMDGYAQLRLGITDFSNNNSIGIYDGVARDVSSSNPGASKVFESGGYKIRINTNGAPQYDNEGIAHFLGAFWESAPVPHRPLSMDCKAY
jgi:hypothetical protein